jgi:hypothetical protein
MFFLSFPQPVRPNLSFVDTVTVDRSGPASVTCTLTFSPHDERLTPVDASIRPVPASAESTPIFTLSSAAGSAAHTLSFG